MGFSKGLDLLKIIQKTFGELKRLNYLCTPLLKRGLVFRKVLVVMVV